MVFYITYRRSAKLHTLKLHTSCTPQVSARLADTPNMTKEQATTEATEISRRDGIKMVVTYNPYTETLDETDKYSYHPHSAVVIFMYDEVVDTIGAEK